MALALPQRTTWTPPRSIVTTALLFLLLLFAFPLMTSLAEDPASAPAPLDSTTQQEMTLLQRINEVRASYGLYPFTYNSSISQAADDHVAEAVNRNWMSHRGANGSSYYDRVYSTGYTPSKVNEAIGWGYNMERQLTWWLNSPVHRAILLSSAYTEIGIGYRGNPGAKWGHWWVVNVAAP